jgi:hypothetical protein
VDDQPEMARTACKIWFLRIGSNKYDTTAKFFLSETLRLPGPCADPAVVGVNCGRFVNSEYPRLGSAMLPIW